MPVTFNIAAGTTIGSVHYLTLGAQNLDFKAKANDTSTTLCTAKTYSTATTCTVDVTFAPRFAGARNGAVELLNGSGNIVATALVYGTGVGPTIAFNSAATTFIGSGFEITGSDFVEPSNIALDGNGDLFASVMSQESGPPLNNVQEMLAVNGTLPANPAINTFGSGLYVGGLGVGGNGSLYIENGGLGIVEQVIAVDGIIPANPVITPLGNTYPFYNPYGLAVDGQGDIFVADTLHNAVKEILAVNGSIPATPTIVTLGSGFIDPDDVAVDVNGNVYVADTGNDAIKEMLAVGGSIPASPTIKTLVSNIPNGAASLSVDAAGDLYYLGNGAGTLTEVLAVNGAIPENPTLFDFSTGYVGRQAMNAAGDIFISYFQTYNILELPRSQAPALSFAGASVGTTSSDSPQSIQIQNIGNAALSLSALSVSGNFELVAGGAHRPTALPARLLHLGHCAISASASRRRRPGL